MANDKAIDYIFEDFKNMEVKELRNKLADWLQDKLHKECFVMNYIYFSRVARVIEELRGEKNEKR